MSAVPLPTALTVRELFEGLVNREVDVATGGEMVDPAGTGGAVVAEYVSDEMRLAAIVAADIPFAAAAGSAIALLPPGTVTESVDYAELTTTQDEAFAEILNVMASLFNLDGGPHLRLSAVHAPGADLPNDVAPWVRAYVPRLDLSVSIRGYGDGALSVVVP